MSSEHISKPKRTSCAGPSTRRSVQFLAEIPDRGESAAEIYEQLEKENTLRKAMNKLSEEFRTVICLRLEERTVGETAEILGMGIGTLKARLFRARQKLRVLLTRSPEFQVNRTVSSARQRREGGPNSHSPAERATSRRSRVAGSKAVVTSLLS